MRPATWRLRSRALDLGAPVVMGVINATPDSFSDSGVHLDPHRAVEAGKAMTAAGARIIDVGGESTRPGAEPVSEGEELERVMPVVTGLSAAGILVSIDTSKPAVAREALEAGAEVVNDITAGRSIGMAELIGSSGAGVVLMHMRGEPRTMQIDPVYQDVVAEVRDFLVERALVMEQAGVHSEAIAIDPGFGFGKTVGHNLELIRRLDALVETGYPVVVGTSRKSFLGRITGRESPADRDIPTAVTTALARERGATVFRVHDVPGSLDALAVTTAIVANQSWDAWSPASNHVDSPG